MKNGKIIISDDEFKRIADYYDNDFSVWTHRYFFDQNFLESKYKASLGDDFYLAQVDYTHKGNGLFKKRRKTLREILKEHSFERKSFYKFSSNNLKDYYLSTDLNICVSAQFTENSPHTFGGFGGTVYVDELHLLFYSSKEQRQKIQEIQNKIENTPDLILWKYFSANNDSK